ncbi:MAG: glycogen/starch/alpha-glucan phosphorylase [Lachnospiraceae bacterium]
MKSLFISNEVFKNDFEKKFVELTEKPFSEGTDQEYCDTLIILLKDRLSKQWSQSIKQITESNERQVFYFSMEFLIGKLLRCYLQKLDIFEEVRDCLLELNIDLDVLIEQEPEAALGNGGLGRLAACFLDSMAFLGIPGHGNGMRYRYGLFTQKIVDGRQVEVPDNWLKNGYPWERRKANKAVEIKYKGEVVSKEVNGRLVFEQKNYESVLAVPYDVPIIGGNAPQNIHNLRLWSAEPMENELNMDFFNSGNFAKAVGYKSETEAISYILYPEDSSASGRELRLKQEYLIVAAGIASIVRRHKKSNDSVKNLADKVAIHINDTHPALAVPELMRILMDEEGLDWSPAWAITCKTISYTNHTILPEALEKWSVDLMRYLLPRIFQIIQEINHRFSEGLLLLNPMAQELVDRTAIIRDGQVHMANLAIIGSYSVNGVAALHTNILKETVFHDLYEIYPHKFNNKTNGVSPRRFLIAANPELTGLLDTTIGKEWQQDLSCLERLMEFKEDDRVLQQLAEVKKKNKIVLAEYIKKHCAIEVNPDSIFDIQVKRFHAYKRQLLNVLEIMDMYDQLKMDPTLDTPPCTFLFAGKAAPSYGYAKTVIKLITTLADKVNQDPDIDGRMKVVFLENFGVSLGELIYPAADISEQISTASLEASGTGNMKFMMNGAITLGTMDGANVELFQQVGEENIRIFGLRADEVLAHQQQGDYRAVSVYETQPRLKRVIDQLTNGFFDCPKEEFKELSDSLLNYNDQFFVLEDFQSYQEAFHSLLQQYKNQREWMKMSLVNIAKSGVFSSDRTIKEYADEIWKLKAYQQSEHE